MAVKVELMVENCPQREAFYDLRAAVPLAEHVASLFRTFFPAASLAAPSRQRSGADGAPGSGERNPNNFGLWVPMHGRFLADEEWETGLPQRHCWVVEGATLQFKTSPACTAAAALYTLKRGEEGRVKAACFELRTSLMDLQLAEEFVDQGGVVELIHLAGDGAKPSLQAYALQALRTALSYEIGTQRLLRAGGAAKLVQLYSADDATAKVVEIALEILFMLCGRADGFKIVHSATLSVARARGEQSYRRLLELIGECDDLVVKTNALMLLNQLIQSAPDRKAKERLLLKLSRRLGVDRLLSSQLHLQEPDFRQQLRVYQQVAGMQIPGSWEQADLFRLKCQRMADELRAVREELQVFETKRPMAKMLLRELGNMREAARLADAQGALAPFASTAPRIVGELRALADEDPEHADEQESEFSRARADVQALQDQLALLEMKSLRLQEHLVDLQARLNTARGERPEAGALYGPVPVGDGTGGGGGGGGPMA